MNLCAGWQGVMSPGAGSGQRTGGIRQRKRCFERETARQLAGQDSGESIARPDRLNNLDPPRRKMTSSVGPLSTSFPCFITRIRSLT